MAWLYQDKWVKGQVIQKGQRECESRYEAIKQVCSQFTRPFSVLDIGANAGYFSFRLATDFPNATVIMIEGNDDEAHLLDLCCQNNLPNIIYLNKRLSLSELQDLADCEFFDVVLALSVIHHFDKFLNEALDVFTQLGDHLVLEIPLAGEHAYNQSLINLEQINVEKYNPTLLMETKSCVGDVNRPTYLIEHKKQRLNKSYLTGGRKGSFSEIIADYNSISIFFPRKKQVLSFTPGINFFTFVAFNGVYPTKSTVTSMLHNVDVTAHEDVRPYNLVVTSNKIVAIDHKDDMSWEKTPPTAHKDRIIRLWEKGCVFELTSFDYWQDVIFNKLPKESQTMKSVEREMYENKFTLLPEDKGKWLSNDSYFDKLITGCTHYNFLEIGSFTGSGSTKFLGNVAKQHGGHLFCIDKFSIPDTQENRDLYKRFGFTFSIPNLYQQFLSNVTHYGLKDVVKVFQGSSDEFFNIYTSFAIPPIGLCYIDGNHGYEIVKRDILNCAKAFPEAILCGDDWFYEPWKTDIQKAVTEAASNLGKKVFSDKNFWWIS